MSVFTSIATFSRPTGEPAPRRSRPRISRSPWEWNILDHGKLAENPLNDTLAAVSCGMVQGFELLDMNYTEDMQAQFDLNVALTGSERYVEIQGTAEGRPVTPDEMKKLLGLAQKGVREILDKMRAALAEREITLPVPNKSRAMHDLVATTFFVLEKVVAIRDSLRIHLRL